MTQMNETCSIVDRTTARAVASGLALAALMAAASAPAQVGDSGNAYNDTGGATSALEDAVRSELAEIGVTSLGIGKLSRAQLAGILLTLTNEGDAAREEAIAVLMDDEGHMSGATEAEDIAGDESIRSAVSGALTRAGWSADVSQLTDRQVAALFDVLAEEGTIETRRIEELSE